MVLGYTIVEMLKKICSFPWGEGWEAVASLNEVNANKIRFEFLCPFLQIVSINFSIDRFYESLRHKLTASSPRARRPSNQ